MALLIPPYRLPLNRSASSDEGPYEDFYVPQFEVKLAPSPNSPAQVLPLEVVRDVIQVTYQDNVQEIDSFSLVISNYESDLSQAQPGLRSKYEPPSRPEFAELFDPGKRIELSMGYQGNLQLMLKGEITTLEPNFQGASLTLSVSGLNVLHSFRAEQHTYAWEDTKDSDIALEIGRNAQTRNRPGIGFPVRIKDAARAGEVPDPYVFMNNQYDIVFLMERARRCNYELVLKEVNGRGQPDPHLYFGPSEGPEAPAYHLEWGRSLVAFRPTLTTARQVSEVVVAGWDLERNQRIEGTASWESLIPRRDSAERARQQRLMQAFGSRREIITDQPVRSQREAEDRARRILRELHKGMVEASGETIGLPDLRAGRKVQIDGVGDRFSGHYYVTESMHTINDGGYKTTFKARREEIE